MAKEQQSKYEKELAIHTAAKELAIHTAAFEKVEPKDNWKMPINCIIDTPTAQERAEINDAVGYFCGCSAEFTNLPNGKTRVTAIGYYMAVGS